MNRIHVPTDDEQSATVYLDSISHITDGGWHATDVWEPKECCQIHLKHGVRIDVRLRRTAVAELIEDRTTPHPSDTDG